MVGDLDLQAAARAVTGVLASHPDARDVQISSLSISFHGAELLTDTNCELNMGRRYGLIGANGCGTYLCVSPSDWLIRLNTVVCIMCSILDNKIGVFNSCFS